MTRWLCILALLGLPLAGCGDEDEETSTETPTAETPEAPEAEAETETETEAPRPAQTAALPDALPNGLLLVYSQFDSGPNGPVPGAARMEILTRSGGEWHVEAVEDPASNVFHKAFVYEPPGAAPGIVTLGGTAAAVKLWRRSGGEWSSETLWEAEFGGTRNRMRDAEVADLYGDGRPAIAVGTHDMGVLSIIRPQEGGGFGVTELSRTPNTWIHEVEIGDLNGDGTLEVYATPSEPNDLDGGEQSGQVVRYVPNGGGGPTVVADLGNRHAKEIWVGDVDGDGRDELYVAVEARTTGQGQNVQIAEPVEIRRYDHDTAPTEGVVIATIPDRLTRFLTVGDLDGDGKREMVAAAFSSGLWLLRPGRDPRAEWATENIDRNSGGFEHASLVADLDDDGQSELYVAADEQGELRRYVWVNGRPRREVIHSRENARSRMTWNLMPVPRSLVE